MKIRVNYVINFCFVLTVLFCGCNKEDLTPAEPKVIVDTTADLVDYVPIYPERTGILVSINNYSFANQNGSIVENITGIAKAIFPDASGNLRSAGNVAVQNFALTASGNHTYSFVPNSNLPSGINFSNTNNLRWTVTGSGDVPSMSFICIAGFPSMSQMITSATSIDRTKDFTVGTALPFNNADSVRFNIFASNGYLFAEVSSQRNSHTFEVSKLSLLNAGTGYVRITAYRTVPLEINGITTIQYVNESVITKSITIR